MAGKRVAGITIEIGGDTTKLSKSLSGVDKEIGKAKGNLKDVEKLLKMDPGNVDLLTQKQKNLTSAISGTEDRLKTLKSVSKESLSDEEWDNLQREIVETEQNLESLKGEYKEFGSVGEQQLKVVGGKIKGVGDKISGVGEKLLPVTGAITGLGAAGVAAMMEMDAGYDTIITKTGATGEALDGLTDQMDRIFADIPTDAEAAGTAIGEVNTRFGLTGDALGDLSKQFIEFSEINGTDLNNAIDQIDKVMDQFGVDTEDAGNVLGLLTKVGQDTGLSMDSLYTSLEKNGTMLRDMGLDLPEAATLLGNLEAAGVNTNTAMVGLKKAWQTANKEGKDFKTVLEEALPAIQNAGSDTEALELATELFGAKAGPEMAEAIKTGKISLDELSSSLSDYGTVVEDTYNSTLDPWDQMTIATNNLKLAGAELGATLLDTFQPAIEAVVGAVQSFCEWLRSLDEDQKNMIVRIGLVVAAIGPALIAIGKVVGIVGSVVGVVGKLSTAFTAIKAAGGIFQGALTLLTGPLGITVAAIAAVVTAGVLLYKNWDKVKEFATKLKDSLTQTFTNIKEKLTGTVDNIKTAVSEKFEGIKNSIKEKMTAAKELVSGIIDKIKGFFSFNITWPKIPLPHFGVVPAGWQIGDLVKGIIPKLGIEWYRSAMNEGKILTSPTIFGYSQGKLLAGGEAGAEAIVGVNSLRGMIQDAVGQPSVNIVVNGAPGQDVNQLADIVSRRLAQQIERRRAVYA